MRTLLKVIAVPWFLWSVVYPNGSILEKDTRWHPVKEYASQKECVKALSAYQVEIDKAYPQPSPGTVRFGSASLTCSPINPK